MTKAAKRFGTLYDTHSISEAVLENLREPYLVLDADLNILWASGSFHRAFQATPENPLGQQLFAFANRTWDFPALRALLGPVLSRHDIITGFKIIHRFPEIGERILLLHARKLLSKETGGTIILIGFEDITERIAIETKRECLQNQNDDLLRQKDILLKEMDHRISNSLQLVASILILKARAVTSDETRRHLQDAYQRVVSVATVQHHLHRDNPDDLTQIGPYFEKLCKSLAQSMIDESHPAVLRVLADDCNVRSGDAVSLGLIVTELVINALKYAFPVPRKEAVVTVRYEINNEEWKLSVSDNGVGRKENDKLAGQKGGLGTILVKALSKQLDAKVETTSSSEGMRVSITHAAFSAPRTDHINEK